MWKWYNNFYNLTDLVIRYLTQHMPCKHSCLQPAEAKCLQNIHSLSACCEVPIWHVVTAIGSVTGLLALGQVCPIIPLWLVDQSWLVFSLAWVCKEGQHHAEGFCKLGRTAIQGQSNTTKHLAGIYHKYY